MIVCLERRGKIFYRQRLDAGEAARIRSKAAGKFAFTVCCRTDDLAVPAVGESFRKYWGEDLDGHDAADLTSSRIAKETAGMKQTPSCRNHVPNEASISAGGAARRLAPSALPSRWVYSKEIPVE